MSCPELFVTQYSRGEFSQNTLRINFKISSTDWPRTVSCDWLQFLQNVEESPAGTAHSAIAKVNLFLS